MGIQQMTSLHGDRFQSSQGKPWGEREMLSGNLEDQ